MRLSACRRLRLRPLTGAWYRVVKMHFWSTRLSTRHTRTVSSRFSVGTEREPSFAILYLAEHSQAAFFEVGHLQGDPENPFHNPRDRSTWVTLRFDVQLHGLADLRDETQRKLIGTTTQELTGRHRLSDGKAPTQQLGAALFQVPRIEAFMTPSAACPGATNLIVFPEKLRARSRIEYFNDETGTVESLERSS